MRFRGVFNGVDLVMRPVNTREDCTVRPDGKGSWVLDRSPVTGRNFRIPRRGQAKEVLWRELLLFGDGLKAFWKGALVEDFQLEVLGPWKIDAVEAASWVIISKFSSHTSAFVRTTTERQAGYGMAIWYA